MRSVMVMRVVACIHFLLIVDGRPETPSLCALPMTAFREISCPRISAISLAGFPSDQSVLSVFIISAVQIISALTLGILGGTDSMASHVLGWYQYRGEALGLFQWVAGPPGKSWPRPNNKTIGSDHEIPRRPLFMSFACNASNNQLLR